MTRVEIEEAIKKAKESGIEIPKDVMQAFEDLIASEKDVPEAEYVCCRYRDDFSGAMVTRRLQRRDCDLLSGTVVPGSC